MNNNTIKKFKGPLLTAVFCLMVVGAGMLGMVKLADSRQVPPHKPEPPRGLNVSAVPVETVSVRLKASGYGQADVVNVQEVSPQVSGNIVEKHPALEEGGMVKKGELLFKIDDTDYAIALEKARAEVKLDEAAIAQYRISLDRDNGRLAAAQKNTLLGKAEYQRLKTLYENDRVGTLSNVETAEQSYNSLQDTEKSLKKTIALYPLQITEAQNDLAKDKADLKTAELNLARCTITAPFSGRIKTEAVETGAYMAAGTSALTLADDRVLEIQVPLSDKDAFEVLGLGRSGNWFSGIENVDCRVESVTGGVAASAAAKIHRVIRYDADSRTLYLAVRVFSGQTGIGTEVGHKNSAGTAGTGISLMEGMFCNVNFEGRQVDNTVKIPLTALNADSTVFLSRDSKLKTLKVSQVTANATHTWVSGAFEVNDFLITSSLSSPVENTAVSFFDSNAMGQGGNQMAMLSGGCQLMGLLIAFARNKVFANLAMCAVMVAGILAGSVMVREDMPEMDLDTIVISVSYDGADPEEIEEGISRKIEDAIDGLEGIDEYTSTSSEGASVTTITVLDGYDADRLLDRVRNEVESINTFPDDADSPSIYRPSIQHAVISLGLVSDMGEARLKEWADTVKKELKRLPGVNQVNLSGTRAYEISVELSQDTLRKYNLTLEEVADIISNDSINRFGGTLRTTAEDIRLRTLGRKYTGQELGAVKVVSGENGQTLYLKDLAEIKDGFTQDNLSIQANGHPAVMINILAGDEDSIDIADTVIQYQEKKNAQLPEGSEIIILSDNTESIRANLSTLYSNAAMGLVFVFILLWLFMDTRISFWAGMGIPVSLLGGLALVHFYGITLNKITLFGLIMVLGIVADDAIVVGEAIFFHRKNGASSLEAVTRGVSEVGLPVLAAIATTIVAFFPLYHIDGVMGKFIVALPTAVIACLLVSLVECLTILPAHLSDLPEAGREKPARNRLVALVAQFHKKSIASMDIAAQRVYLPLLRICVRFRYLFVCLCLSFVMICMGLVAGGFIKFNVFPDKASSIVTATVEFPEGTPFETTRAAVKQIESAALEAADGFDTLSGSSLVENRLTTVGQEAGEKMGQSDNSSPHVGGVRITLADPGESGVHSAAFITAWEKACGAIPGARSLEIGASNAGPPGAPVEICLQGTDLEQMAAVSEKIKEELRTINGVSQIFDDNVPGKNELKLSLRPEARYLGISTDDLADEIQQACYGALALKIQRDNDEVDVYVRLTDAERQTRETLAEMKIKTGDNTWIPLSAVADIDFGPGPSSIVRKDGYRQIKVSANVDNVNVVAGDVTESLANGLFKDIQATYPDVAIHLEGDAKRSSESFGSLYLWVPLSIMLMFLIIATIFRSYIQPFLILLTIPFGLVGAVVGHLVMGHMLSLLSVFGMVALAGVVVNDAIVLIERVNMNLAEGMGFFDAVYQGGMRRFRAVMLTSISTVGGLSPLIMETSQHAQQLIPMGISLAFGVAFATVLTLVLLPCLMVIINDVRWLFAGGLFKNDILRNTLEPAFRRIEDAGCLLPAGEA